MVKNEIEIKKATEEICAKKDFSVRQYTDWQDGKEMIKTSYGRVSFVIWAALEKRRIEERGGKVSIWVHPKDKTICLTLDHEFIVTTGNKSNYGSEMLQAINW